jgi:hypothetical protein
MRRAFCICLLLLATALVGLKATPTPTAVEVERPVYQVINTQRVETPYRIRLVALKHSHISMADGDANLAIQAANAARSKGLDIRDVANQNIDPNGAVKVVMWTENDPEKLKAYISSLMKIDAQPGDTFIIFTIGHGSPDGSLQGMGQRAWLFKAFAAAAEENQQRTLWWQLSCHASAGLPAISTLPPSQQEYFSVYASSTAQNTSAAGVQGRIMEKVFLALANRDRSLDDGSDIVTAARLRNFLNGVSNASGNLLYAANPDTPIFGGGFGLANQLPIVDRNSQPQQYPKNYIPLPRSR